MFPMHQRSQVAPIMPCHLFVSDAGLSLTNHIELDLTSCAPQGIDLNSRGCSAANGKRPTTDQPQPRAKG